MNAIDPMILGRSDAPPFLQTSFVRLSETTFAGHVFAPDDPLRKFTVEIASDGFVLQTVRADLPTRDRTAARIGDGCYGFTVDLPLGALAPGAILEARIANLDLPVGARLVIDPDQSPTLPEESATGLQWLGGLRFSAWIAGREPASLDVMVDGQLVLQARATGWRSVAREDDRPARTFDFHLPDRFADGAAHRVAVREDGGELFGGCACPFVAFDNGLAAAVRGFGGIEGERLRAELFDRLMPMSWPFARYSEWRERFPPDDTPPSAAEIAVILTGGDSDGTVESLKQQTGAAWVAAALPQGDNAFSFAPDLMRNFLDGEAARCPIVVLAPGGTRFAPDALRRLAAPFTQSEETFAAYGDLEVLGEDETPWPLCFPAFDYERMLEQGYCSLVFALRRSHAERALEDGAANLFRLFNAQLDAGTGASNGIVHVPGPVGSLPRLNLSAASAALAEASATHLRRRAMTADAVPGKGAGSLPEVRIRRQPAAGASVAIVVMTDGASSTLPSCLAAILPEARQHDAEIVIAGTRLDRAEITSTLADDGIMATVVTADGPFSAARVANLAARSTDRDYLCLVADDVVAAEAGWLGEMLGRIADPCVGAVSPLLLGSHGLVREAGIVLGPAFSTAPAFADAKPGGEYGGMLSVAHQQSALGAGCLLTWRGDYLAVGGMDEIHFPFEFADIDFCLKLRAAHRRIVVTPHARLTRSGPARTRTPDTAPHSTRARDALRARWGETLAADPYYSPLLSLDPVPWSALAWPRRSSAPRRAETPVPVPMPEGF